MALRKRDRVEDAPPKLMTIITSIPRALELAPRRWPLRTRDHVEDARSTEANDNHNIMPRALPSAGVTPRLWRSGNVIAFRTLLRSYTLR